MRTLPISIAALSALLLIGAGCAQRPTTVDTVNNQPKVEVPNTATETKPAQPTVPTTITEAEQEDSNIVDVSQDDLEKLKAEIKNSIFDDVSSLKE